MLHKPRHAEALLARTGRLGSLRKDAVLVLPTPSRPKAFPGDATRGHLLRLSSRLASLWRFNLATLPFQAAGQFSTAPSHRGVAHRTQPTRMPSRSSHQLSSRTLPLASAAASDGNNSHDLSLFAHSARRQTRLPAFRRLHPLGSVWRNLQKTASPTAFQKSAGRTFDRRRRRRGCPGALEPRLHGAPTLSSVRIRRAVQPVPGIRARHEPRFEPGSIERRPKISGHPIKLRFRSRKFRSPQ